MCICDFSVDLLEHFFPCLKVTVVLVCYTELLPVNIYFTIIHLAAILVMDVTVFGEVIVSTVIATVMPLLVWALSEFQVT